MVPPGVGKNSLSYNDGQDILLWAASCSWVGGFWWQHVQLQHYPSYRSVFSSSLFSWQLSSRPFKTGWDASRPQSRPQRFMMPFRQLEICLYNTVRLHQFIPILFTSKKETAKRTWLKTVCSEFSAWQTVKTIIPRQSIGKLHSRLLSTSKWKHC